MLTRLDDFIDGFAMLRDILLTPLLRRHAADYF